MNILGARSAGLDAVRVVGIIAIVAGHVWTDVDWKPFIYAWHVPVFFVLTGYLWKRTRTDPRAPSISPVLLEAKKRSISLLVPYITWLTVIGVLYLAARVVVSDKSVLSGVLSILLGGSYLGRPFSAFWFVTALFALAMLVRALDHWPAWVGWVIAALGLLAAYAWPSAVTAAPWALGATVSSLVFVLVGRLMREILPTIKYPLTIGAMTLILGFLPAALGSSGVDIKAANFGIPIVDVAAAILISAGLILVATEAYTHLPLSVHLWTSRLAQAGFAVILTHAAFLWVLDTPGSGSTLHFMIALLVPGIAAFIAMRTPMSLPLTGTRRSTSVSA